MSDLPLTSEEEVIFERHSKEPIPIRLRWSATKHEGAELWWTHVTLCRKESGTKMTLTALGARGQAPMETYMRKTHVPGWRIMKCLQEPLGRVVDATNLGNRLLRPGKVWQNTSGILVVAASDTELATVINLANSTNPSILRAATVSYEHRWQDDLENQHVIQYEEDGPIGIDHLQYPLWHEGCRYSIYDITICPWYDLSLRFHDHLCLCYLDHLSEYFATTLRDDQNDLEDLDAEIVDIVPDPFNRLAKTDSNTGADNYVLQDAVVAHCNNGLLLIAQSPEELKGLARIIGTRHPKLATAQEATLECLDPRDRTHHISSEEETMFT